MLKALADQARLQRFSGFQYRGLNDYLYYLRAAPGAGSASSCTGQYSHLGPPKARVPGLVWACRAPLMLMMLAPAVRIMRSRPRAEAASSNLLALHRAAQKPAPTPHGTRARFAAIHQLISSFRVRAGNPAGARITSISGTPATRRRRVGGLCGPPLKASPLRLRQALAAYGRGHRRGPLRCPIFGGSLFGYGILGTKALF